MLEKNFIPSVNFHLWQPCNMRCHYCFATFQDVKSTVLPKGHLPKDEALAVVQELADFGFKKITFAGGEPTLCPWLFDLVKLAKSLGMTTMIVSNGSRLDSTFLDRFQSVLDWISISVDSLSEKSNLNIGRALIGKKALSRKDYISLVQRIRSKGYRLKINTVVSQANHKEDFHGFLHLAQAERWKVFQVLPVTGQNDACVDRFLIGDSPFKDFLKRHQDIKILVPETNKALKGSYVMVDPAGRFYTNTEASYRYSSPILEIGVSQALSEMEYDLLKFKARGGIYNWSNDS